VDTAARGGRWAVPNQGRLVRGRGVRRPHAGASGRRGFHLEPRRPAGWRGNGGD